LNVSSSDSKKCTLAQGLVALNQLTHTNCFWIFSVCGTDLGPVARKLGVGVYIRVCGCFWGDGRISEVVSCVFHSSLDVVDVSKLGLWLAGVADIGVLFCYTFS
jgi:hypothetical protein